MCQGGRTETIRSCSEHTDQFCSLVMDPGATPAARVAALRQAVQAHREYTELAMDGHGCDRHLLGLKVNGN